MIVFDIAADPSRRNYILDNICSPGCNPAMKKGLKKNGEPFPESAHLPIGKCIAVKKIGSELTVTIEFFSKKIADKASRFLIREGIGIVRK